MSTRVRRHISSQLKKIGASSLTLLMGGGMVWALTSLGSSSEPPQLSLSSEKILAAQINEDLRRALESHALSENDQQWRESGFTPKDLIKNIRDLKSPKARALFCEGLTRLPPSKLVLFEEELALPQNQDVLPCRTPLVSKAQGYWTAQRREFSSLTRGEPKKTRTSKRQPKSDIRLAFTGSFHPVKTRELLKILKQEKIHATFFFDSESLRKSPEAAHLALSQGHALGVKVESDKPLHLLPITEAEKRMDKAMSLVKTASAGHRTRLKHVLLPHGTQSQALETWLSSKNLELLKDPVDSFDWKTADPKALYDSLLSHRYSEGKSQSAHSTRSPLMLSTQREQTLIMLPALVHRMKSAEFTETVAISNRKPRS
jgi:peptidoglycan/xylan/chitin deacetylase (PgdA/CDA1 family)